MDIELLEIRDFLVAHPPFDQLPEAALERLPKRLSVRYLRRGSPFPPADADGDYLYLVRRGAVELRDGGDELVDKFGEGELCAPGCPADSELTGTVVEDTLFYLLPCAEFQALRGDHPGFDQHFTHALGERLQRARQAVQGGDHGLVMVAVGELLQRPPVTAEAQIPIREAARRMTHERVSSLLLIEDGRLAGIVTDRDLRVRCLAEGVSPERPVAEIMSRLRHRLERDTPGFEALLTMARLELNHLPVMEGERLLGVVSAKDLIRYQSANALYLAGDLRRCRSREELAAACRELPELQVRLMAAGTTAEHLGQALATVGDALTRRLLQLAERVLGPPPVAYCWLAGGSQARREQTVHTDQDNALLLDDAFDLEAHGRYFTELARFVCDGLDECGFHHCPGEVTAANPRWRQPRRTWRDYFQRWIGTPERKALMLACNFFDLRPVHGAGELWQGLIGEVLARVRADSIFLAHLAANALHNRPPLGFFRHFVLISGGEHDHRLDLKLRGLMPVVDLARVYALAAGLPELNTHERLQAAARAGGLSGEGAADLGEAYELIATLRARHQAGRIKRGEAPDNFLAPEELPPLERRHLKDAFGVIKTHQQALAQAYQSERFT